MAASVNELYNAIIFIFIDPPSVYVEADTATIIKESAETNVSLFCRVQRGNPRNLSTVQWYFNNIPMYKYPNVSNLFLEKVKKEHHGNYSCSGKTEAGWGFVSPPKEVIVQCTFILMKKLNCQFEILITIVIRLVVILVHEN